MAESAASFPVPRSKTCPFDPPAEYSEWRENERVKKVTTSLGYPAWLFTRYDDVREVLASPHASSDRTLPGRPLQGNGIELPPLNTTFISQDEPRHNQIRRMYARDLTVKSVQALGSDIQSVVDEHLNGMISHGAPVDLVAEFALPIPSRVICQMLGVPYSTHGEFQQSSNTLINQAASDEEKGAAMMRVMGLLGDVLKIKQREPGDDLMSRLLQYVVAGELTPEEAVINTAVVLIAGHETTANMLATGTLALLRHPEQLRMLRAQPELIDNAIEELLRYLTVAQAALDRMALQDIQVADRQFAKGDGLLVHAPSANRDAHQFPDPDTLDITRSNARQHLAFGYGPHQCPGQALARMEMRIALPALLNRLPGLRLAVPFEELTFKGDNAVYGVEQLPIAW